MIWGLQGIESLRIAITSAADISIPDISIKSKYLSADVTEYCFYVLHNPQLGASV